MSGGTAALIVAGGRGTRMGADLPKQYLDIGGRTILARSVSAFLDLPDIAVVQVVIAAGDEALCADALRGLNDARLRPPVPGGATRALSVRAGLDALADAGPDHVLIHDAARPFVPAEVILAVLAALGDAEGAFAALPVVDALWRADGDRDYAPVPRAGLYRAQTPQGFRFDAIRAAHARAPADAADDVEVARAAGLEVRLVEGSEENFKITTEADLRRARRHLDAP
ncbi:2-C-methyl-D-erythritol 4-phosphate cytidylyltransferase [Silicimonas algicola]|uniref:2-C-methyl-D-erythritol 4-phosphate cytidylyltransferase n=1 Tax=Silicimonas algicola TaxID=1826607 RepID=A0A316GII8_9RHOB|nr:2-C-methyl-D-erythritol 4-phosphate cytidylyltransferase [Silicimonas algicola]AZQ68259.1 2-C-methyl-D-erythritol 4-phosphate cytidylyltransferase [Silicimonas algicola]PWK54607.1 2-C-methyl-D-erythritol 4-phosphate cytidylyltransferase [Silicimonas algicola]